CRVRRLCMPVGSRLMAFLLRVAAFCPRSVLPLAVAIFPLRDLFHAALDPYAALLADITPVLERGLLSGISSAIQYFSQVVFLLIVFLAARAAGEVPLAIYALVGAVMVISFAATIIGINERREPVARKEHYSLRRYVGAVLGQHGAMRYLATNFVYQFGINAVLPYLTLFIIEDIHQTQDIAFALAGLTLLVTAASAVVSGKLAERVGTR